MRTWGITAITVAICLAAVGCGKKDEGAGESAETEETDETEAPDQADETANTDQEPEEETAEEPIPTPDAFDPAEPVHVNVLKAALDPWSEGSEVTVIGYPKFFIGDTGQLQRSAELVAEPGSDKDTPTLVRCKMAEPHLEEVENSETLVMKGELDGHYGDKEDKVLAMKSCDVVETGTEIDPDVPADPTQDEPIPADKLHDAFWSWIGKEVAVTGYYRALTISRNPKNKKELYEVRLDISPSAKERGKVLSCELAKEEPSEEFKEKLEQNRADTVFKGEISEQVFDTWQLQPCEVTNR